MPSHFFDLEHFINASHLTTIRQIGVQVIPHLPTLLDDFYGWIQSKTVLKAYFSSDEAMNKVKISQHEYWTLFWEAQVDDAYWDNRYQVGCTHARIGLPLALYYHSVAHFNHLFEALFVRLGIDQYDFLAAFNRLIHLDVSIVVESYKVVDQQLLEQTIMQQTNALADMSTPISQLWDGVLMLPLLGFMDSHRAKKVMQTMLQQIQAHHCRVMILDISGIAVMDTAVANHLVQMTKAAKLMGSRCMVSGLSPHVAQTIVELGIETQEIETYRSIKDALEEALQGAGR